jgi:predicted nucleic acid-binding protein
VLSYFAEDGSYARALAAQATRRALIDLRVVSVDRALFTRALDLYERRSDKEYSLVDCISMVLIKDSGITYVLTNDHHFRQEGFTVLSDIP